jgi:hypothetical protein
MFLSYLILQKNKSCTEEQVQYRRTGTVQKSNHCTKVQYCTEEQELYGRTSEVQKNKNCTEEQELYRRTSEVRKEQVLVYQYSILFIII